MSLNINAGAPGNPLDALLGGKPLQGTVGRSISDTVAAAMSGDTGARDWLISNGYGHMVQTGESPYFEMTQQGFNPNGYITRNGNTYSQLRSTNIGGPGEATDPSQVLNDPTYGLLAPVNSIKKPADLGGWIGPAVIALGTAAMGAYAGGLLGGAGEAAGTAGSNAGLDAAINASQIGSASEGASLYGGSQAAADAANASLMGDLGGSVGSSAANAGLDLSPIAQTPAGSITPLQAGPYDGLLGGQSVTGLLGQAGQWAMNNPLRAAGLAQTAYGLLGGNRGGSSGSSGGSSKGGMGQGLTPGNGQQQQFYVNPYTLAQLQRSRGGQ